MVVLPTQIIIWAGALTLSAALVKAAYAGLVLLLASMLPPNEYAHFGLLYAAQTAIGTFAGVGVQETAVGKLAGRSTAVRRLSLFRSSVALFYLTAAVALIVIGLLVIATNSEEIGRGAILFALALGGINAFALLQAALIRLDERYGASLAFGAGVPLLGCAGIACGAYLGRSIEAIFAGGAIGSVIGVGLLAALGYGYFGTWPTCSRLRTHIKALGPFVIMGVFGWLGGYGIIFVITNLFDPPDLARYTFLFTVSAVAQMAASAANMVWSPRFYRLYLTMPIATVEAESRRFFAIQATALGLIGAGFVAILPWLGNVLGGYARFYGTMQWELALLFVSYVFIVPWWHSQNYYLVANKGASLMRTVVWMGSVGMCVWLACMWLFGSLGIYIGFALQSLLKSFGAWFVARKEWGVSPPWIAIGVAVAITCSGLLVPYIAL